MIKDDIFLKSIEYANPRYLAQAVAELGSPENAEIVHMVVSKAVQMVIGMDLLSETDDLAFITLIDEYRRNIEFLLGEKRRVKFKIMHDEIVAPYFFYEKNVQELMKKGHKFHPDDVKLFSMKHSSDALVYGGLAGLFVPALSPSLEVIHKIQEIEDMGDAIDDYEEDIKSGSVNLVAMHLLSMGITPPDTMGDVYGWARLSSDNPNVMKDLMRSVDFIRFYRTPPGVPKVLIDEYRRAAYIVKSAIEHESEHVWENA